MARYYIGHENWSKVACYIRVLPSMAHVHEPIKTRKDIEITVSADITDLNRLFNFTFSLRRK